MKPTTTEDMKLAAGEAIYRALERYDRELRSLRNLRAATGGRGPTTTRGTRRGALARYLAEAAIAALDDEHWT